MDPRRLVLLFASRLDERHVSHAEIACVFRRTNPYHQQGGNHHTLLIIKGVNGRTMDGYYLSLKKILPRLMSSGFGRSHGPLCSDTKKLSASWADQSRSCNMLVKPSAYVLVERLFIAHE